ncbi:MAG: hypothetical protein CMK59_08585 [Proteobacteria bacterium]|nr:hypothetical protein [Pseudomonadota bacterium]
MKLQNRYTWFSDWLGLSESDFLERRHECIVRIEDEWLGARNVKSGDVWSAGDFTVCFLDDLKMKAVSQRLGEFPIFEIVVRKSEEAKPLVDVAHLQSVAKPRSLFQVASNFNCAEVASVLTDVESGQFVSRNALDVTQGPAASASAAISLVTRIHAPFYDEGIVSDFWGQGEHRQVELLGDPMLAEHFPVTNGKLIFDGSEPLEFEPDESLLGGVGVGLHCNAPAYFGRRVGDYMICSDPVPVIDQVFVATLNWNAPHAHAQYMESKNRFLLQAAYEGTYLAAVKQRSKHLVLTLVGGGSFSNPLQWIAQSIAQAHKKWGMYSQLNKVVLPLYGLNGVVRGVRMDELLVESLRTVGIPKERIVISEVSSFNP